MNLEIFSLGEALRYVPSDKTGIIRIFDGFDWYHPPLKPSPNWIDVEEGVGEYSFDDQWPSQDEAMSAGYMKFLLKDVWTKKWKEYEGFSELDSRRIFSKKVWHEYQKKFPMATEESMLSLFETRGQEEERPTYFTQKKTRQIFEEYDKYWKDADTLVIASGSGKHRPTAIGIAMNEICGWGIEGLKEEHPNYRRFIYWGMMKTAGKLKIV
jgi:hypothetical protein